MAPKLVLALLTVVLTGGPAIACMSPNPVLSDKLAADPHYFGKDGKNSYQSGSEFYLIPERANFQYTYFEDNEPNVDFCSTMRIVDALEGSYGGLAFWFADAQNLHAFIALSDGRFAVTRRRGGQWEQPIAFYDRPQALQRSAQYELEVQTIGSRVALFVNGIQLGTFTADSEATQHKYGYIAGGDTTRPIFAFSKPSASIIDGLAGEAVDDDPHKPPPPPSRTTSPPSPAVANSDSNENPNVGNDVEEIFYLVRFLGGSGASDFFPDRFKLQSFTQPAETGSGSSDMIFRYAAKDETSEMILRFFPTKELAAGYWADGKSSPLYREASALGPVLTIGSQSAKGIDSDVGYVAGTSADNRTEWVRSFANTGSLIFMVTTERPRRGHNRTAPIDKNFITETTSLLASATSSIIFDVGVFGNAADATNGDKSPDKK